MSTTGLYTRRDRSIRRNGGNGQPAGLALVSILIGLIMSLMLGGLVLAQGEGALEGQVVNGTAGAAEVGAGVRVVLHVVQDNSEVKSLETATDAGGRFRFEGLDTSEGLEYWPEAFYKDVPYSSAEPSIFGGDQTTLAAIVLVYETTQDDSAISLGPVHLIAESFDQVLRISEIHLFGNGGDRTYTGSSGEAPGTTEAQTTTVFIPLPENAVGLGFDNEVEAARFVEVEGGLMDTKPVPPGAQSSVASFSYHLLVADQTVPLERRFSYPVTSLNLLVAQPELSDAIRWTVKSNQLESMGIQTLMGRQYDVYVAQNLSPDQPLVLEFVPATEAAGASAGEMPASSSQEVTGAPTKGSQSLLRWLGFGLALLAVVGAVVYPQLSKQPAPARRSASALASAPEARRLLAELADLEVAFEEGRMDEASYERRRAEIYEKLRTL
jgi:hypothetical protein